MPATVQAPIHAVGRQYSVEAQLTSLDSRQTVTAASLEITAQKTEMAHGAPLWAGVNGGMQQCGNCASVEILNTPVESQRISVHVGLREGLVAGLLYLVSF